MTSNRWGNRTAGGTGVAVASAVLTFLFACTETAPPGYRVPTAADSSEGLSVCPSHDSVWVPSKSGLFWSKRDTLAIPGMTTTIPEFHDCQRLLASKDEYGPEAGVYASREAGSSMATARLLSAAGAAEKAVGVAEIVSAGKYPLLHLETGINCLYLFIDGNTPRAFMMEVPDGADCPTRQRPRTSNRLEVTEHPEIPIFTAADFSQSARWDWDNRPRKLKQFIGLPCGMSYCAYGHIGAESSFSHDKPGGTTKERRVRRIQTWYDEQNLGIIQPPGTTIRPSGVFGTVFPDTGLGDRTYATYEAAGPTDPYLPSAEVQLTATIPQYQTKFGLVATSGTATNKVALCKGDATRCIPPGTKVPTCRDGAPGAWFARITPEGGTPVYRCVLYHYHGSFPIPGNARWWWDSTDEGIWMRCPQGCCQVG